MGRNIAQKVIDKIRGKNPDVNLPLKLKSVGGRVIRTGGGGT